MNRSPDLAVVARLTWLLLAYAFCPLAVFTAVIVIRRFIIIPKFRKEFLALHTRRVARARLALAGEAADRSDDSSTTPALARAYPFSGWIDLGKDGTVAIAGQSFRPTETFQAIARDGNNNIPHATAVGTGQEVFITSYGQTFRAKFATEWDVQLLEDDQP